MRKARATVTFRRKAATPTPWEEWVSTEPAAVDENGELRARIERLAYAYWEQRGCEHGHAEDDWYRAEAEILGARS